MSKTGPSAYDKSAEEIVYYLEMNSRADARLESTLPREFHFRRAMIPVATLNYYFYSTVGRPWNWTDRFCWSKSDWEKHVSQNGLQTWIGYFHSTPAGYAELLADDQGGVEISSFGLIPEFIGKGIGKAMLSAAIEAAWQFPAQRVWLHTCSFDHPHALANYQARGFKLYNTVKQTKYFYKPTPDLW